MWSANPSWLDDGFRCRYDGCLSSSAIGHAADAGHEGIKGVNPPPYLRPQEGESESDRGKVVPLEAAVAAQHCCPVVHCPQQVLQLHLRKPEPQATSKCKSQGQARAGSRDLASRRTCQSPCPTCKYLLVQVQQKR
ncbi:uncharacterized protein TRIVIDRAFT_199738 [Trichoderma virens Gv29-8]|uniref:Uncharacterized protein n=1 Tax=Hypocrea virens (strain Gv29-8 / FGSC 10586) TaxID=413071 RepID=G9MNA2_HYPVG|nr:uncharacterized protein TRIVIDRAFT_199738 [Trichoderma virens Gv29-8]EHK23358.1 hypothetical protein TRIVIDRAFT_199738 [Trichoderma virens Gv29-8]